MSSGFRRLLLAGLSAALLVACRQSASDEAPADAAGSALAAPVSSAATEQPDAPCGEILDPVEPVVLLGQPQLRVKARIDTGAELASLDLDLAQRLGLDRPVLREISIRNAHGVTRRPVVRLKFLIRGQVRTAEVSLYPRNGLDHPMLLGRQSLKGFLVDPAGDVSSP